MKPRVNSQELHCFVFKQYLKGSLPRMCKGSLSLMSLPEVEDHEEASRKISGMEA